MAHQGADNDSPDTQQIAAIKRRLLMTESELFDEDYNESGFSPVALELSQDVDNEDRRLQAMTSDAAGKRDERSDPFPHDEASARANIVRLIPTKSSPPIEAERAHVATDRMYKTFDGLPVVGDTQPMDSQVYSDYIKKLNSSVYEPLVEDGQDVDITEEVNDTKVSTQGSEHMRGYDAGPGAEAMSDSQLTDFSPDAVDNELHSAEGHFRLPKTPGLAGRKRDHQGRMVESHMCVTAERTPSTKTPGSEMVALLGRGGRANIMSLTQAFGETQALSSPTLHNIRSDPIFARPSPDAEHFRQSSPPDAVTSPIKFTPLRAIRVSSVPLSGERLQPSSDLPHSSTPLRTVLATRGTDKVSAEPQNLPLSDSSRLEKSQDVGDDSKSIGQSASGADHAINIDSDMTFRDGPIQIPMTSSRTERTQPPQATPSRPSDRQQGVPGTASSAAGFSHNVGGASQTLAIADSQKGRSDSQKENVNPSASSREEQLQPLKQMLGLQIATGAEHVYTSTHSPSELVNGQSQAILTGSPLTSTSQLSDVLDSKTTSASTEAVSSPVSSASSSIIAYEVIGSNEIDSSVQRSAPYSKTSTISAPIDSSRPRHSGTGDHDSSGVRRFISHDHAVASTMYQTAQSSSPPRASVNEQSLLQPDIFTTPRADHSQHDQSVHTGKEPGHMIDLDLEPKDDFLALLTGSSPVGPSRKGQRQARASMSPSITASELPKLHHTLANEDARKAARAVQSRKRQRLCDRDLYSFSQEMEREDQSRAHSPMRAATTLPTKDSIQVSPARSAQGKLARPSSRLKEQLRNACSPRTKDPGSAIHIATIEKAATQDATGNTDAGAPDLVDVGVEPVSDKQAATSRTVITDVENWPRSAPDRVLAMYKDGRHNNYYPATCVSSDQDQTFVVRFDDGLIATLKEQYVRRLDLLVGDVVKVDLQGLRKEYFVVQGLQAAGAAENGAEAQDITSVEQHGFGDIVLVNQRHLHGPNASAAGLATTNVAVANIYLTHSLMWPRFSARTYQHVSQNVDVHLASTPAAATESRATTPPSRRKATTSYLQNITRDASAASLAQESGLFRSMAFAVSFGDESSAERRQVLRHIQANGGTVLDYGFDDLFLTPEVSDPASATIDMHDTCATNLELTSRARKFGFVALITDDFSRRVKYLQALALDIPCLQYDWINDSIEAKRLMDMESYFLASGKSSKLRGAIRSRLIPLYDPRDVTFSTIVEQRKKLLAEENSSIIFVNAPVDGLGSTARSGSARGTSTQGKRRRSTKALDKDRKMFVFMTWAIGATRIRRVADTAQAKHVLGEAGALWGWVHVEGDIDAAAAELGLDDVLTTGMSDGTGKRGRSVRVVDNEFVIQSLILGRLMPNERRDVA